MSAKQSRPTPTNQAADQRLLTDIALAMIRRHTIEEDELKQLNGWGGRVEKLCLSKAMMLNGQTLGRIVVAYEHAGMYEVHGGSWLGKYESGPYLLQQIAATAIVWRIQVLLGVRVDHGYSGCINTMPWDTHLGA